MKKELIETIKIEDGKVCNIEWHNRRLHKSILALFHQKSSIELQKYILPPTKKGLFRCRILYDTQIKAIEYFSYYPKEFKSFQILQSQLDYSYKYSNRSELNQLLKESYADEIIIEKDNLLTDTSIANIAFYDGKSWLTPKKPLLEGTTRARLINEGFLKLHDIKKEDIKNYSHFALMNAMIGFQIQKSINIQL